MDLTEAAARRVKGRSDDLFEDADITLLWQATARADALLDDLTAGRFPDHELGALLDYLREVVLARINEEERQVLPALAGSGRNPDIQWLRRQHLLLSDDVEQLAAAAAPHGSRDAEQLSALIRRLIVRLEEHLRAEAAALAGLAGGDQSSSAGWVTAQRWYLLTEGPVIDLAHLRPDQVDDAVLNRLTQLRLGEQVELRGDHDTRHLWRRLQQRFPGDYSWSDRDAGPHGRLVTVTRRARE